MSVGSVLSGGAGGIRFVDDSVLAPQAEAPAPAHAPQKLEGRDFKESGKRLFARRLANADFTPAGEAEIKHGLLVLPVAGDAFFGGRAELVANHVAGTASLVQRGFLQRYDTPIDGGPAKWRDVLGAPRDEEHSDEHGRVVQNFENGVMWWTPSAGLHALVSGARTPKRGLSAEDYCATMLDASLFNREETTHAFRDWALRQAGTNRHIGATYRAIEDILSGPRQPAATSALARRLLGRQPSAAPLRPETMKMLFQRARTAAETSLSSDGDYPTDRLARTRTTTLVTLIALAAHALQNHHGESKASSQFPPYLPDGRQGETACDRAWHFFNHAMLSFADLYNKTYADDPHLSAKFREAVELIDPNHDSEHIRRVYHQVRGKVGSVLPGTLPGPKDSVGSYAPEIRYGDPDARDACNLAIRVGFAYESLSSPAHDGAALGSNIGSYDPLEAIDATHDHHSGVGDPNWTGDCSANIRGAQAGVELFDKGGRAIDIPDDIGWAFTDQTFGSFRVVPANLYLAGELARLDVLADPEADGRAREANYLGGSIPDQLDQLEQRLSGTVDALYTTDLDRLARFYANFSVRYLQWVGRTAGSWEETKSFQAHYDWAKAQSAEILKEHFLRRVQACADRFEVPLSAGLSA